VKTTCLSAGTTIKEKGLKKRGKKIPKKSGLVIREDNFPGCGEGQFLFIELLGVVKLQTNERNAKGDGDRPLLKKITLEEHDFV